MSDEMQEEPTVEVVTIYPDWKQAVEDLLEEGVEDGKLITHEWIDRHFKLAKPKVGTPKEFEEYAFKRLAALEAFKNELLEVYQIALRSISGKGYEIVPPFEQTKYAERAGMDIMERGIKKWARTAANLRADELTDEQRKQNADSLSRLGWLRSTIAQAGRVTGAGALAKQLFGV